MNVAMPLKKVPVLKLILVIRNKSVQELANFVGNERSQVSTWVNGRDEPSREQAQKIAEYLKWDLGEIWEDPPTIVKKKQISKQKVGKAKLVDEGSLKMSESAPAAGPALYVLPPLDRRLTELDSIDKAPGFEWIPVWPESIAAGSLDDNQARQDADKIWIPASMLKLDNAKAYAIRIAGTSMTKAGIVPGSICIVRNSSSAKDEEIVIAEQHGGVTCKRKRTPMLIAESDTDASIRMTKGSRVLGVVKAVWRPRSPQ